MIANGDNWIGFEKSGTSTDVWIAGSDFEPIHDSFSGSIRRKRVTITYSSSDRALSIYVEEDLSYHKDDLDVGDAPPNGTFPLNIGMYENEHLPSYWEGPLDQAIFLGRILTEEEVLELCNTENISTLSFYNDIIAWWPLGESDFPQIQDLKGEYNGFYKNGSANDFISYD